jgi:hypothetical protein
LRTRVTIDEQLRPARRPHAKPRPHVKKERQNRPPQPNQPAAAAPDRRWASSSIRERDRVPLWLQS